MIPRYLGQLLLVCAGVVAGPTVLRAQAQAPSNGLIREQKGMAGQFVLGDPIKKYLMNLKPTRKRGVYLSSDSTFQVFVAGDTIDSVSASTRSALTSKLVQVGSTFDEVVARYGKPDTLLATKTELVLSYRRVGIEFVFGVALGRAGSDRLAAARTSKVSKITVVRRR